MNTTAQIRPSWTQGGPQQSTDPRRSERLTFGETLAEIVPLVDVVPAYGPPAVFVLGPWLLLVLMLAGPLGWLFALVAVLIVAASVLAALAAAILGAPYLLVRHLRRRRAGHASIGAPAAQRVAIESPRVAA